MTIEIRDFKIEIDDEDVHLLKHYKWRLHKGYLSRNDNNKTLYLHRVIMNAQKGQIIDHIDMNPLNLKKSNMRFCTKAQNSMNRSKPNKKTFSKYKGVGFDPRRPKPFRSFIAVNGKHKFLGYFKTEEEAAMSYNIAAQQHHGEFARLNPISTP